MIIFEIKEIKKNAINRIKKNKCEYVSKKYKNSSYTRG